MAPLTRVRSTHIDDAGLVAGAIGAAVLGGVALTVTAYLYSPLVLPALLIALAFVVLTFVRPAWGVAGALAAVPLEAVGLKLGGGGLSPSEAALALVGVVWVCRALLRPETVVMPSVRDTPIVVLLGAVAVGVVLAQDSSPVVRVLVLWTLFYFVYLQVQTFTTREIQMVVIAFILGAAVLGGVGAIDYLRSGTQQTLFAGGEQTGARAAGTFVDPNYYGSLLVLALLPALALAINDVRRFAFIAVGVAVTFAGLALSLSRGAMLGFGAGVLLLLVWRRARWTAVTLTIVVIVLTLANANPLVGTEQVNIVQERLSTLGKPGTAEEASLRPQIWGTASEVAAAHPFFGIGVNQFEFEAARRGLFEQGDPLENAHSVVFSLAAETGLIGLAAFIAFVGQLGVRAARALRTRDTLRYALALGFAAALLGFVIQGLTVAQIRVPIITGAFFALAGMLTALSDRVSHTSSSTAGT